MSLIDISPLIAVPDLHTWPGDQPYTLAARWQKSKGAAVNVATVTSSGHVGSHIDAPLHVKDGTPGIENIPLAACIGECLVVDISEFVDRSSTPHGFVTVTALQQQIRKTLEIDATAKIPFIPRLLLRHQVQALKKWDTNMPGLDPAAVHWFGEQGGMLLGIDLDSFDPEVCRDLPAHNAALEHGIVILEGLELTAAPVGWAEIYAPPVRWQGADAAPVRAVLKV